MPDCPYCIDVTDGPGVIVRDTYVIRCQPRSLMAFWREHGGTTRPGKWKMLMHLATLADRCCGHNGWVERWETDGGHLRVTIVPISNGRG